MERETWPTPAGGWPAGLWATRFAEWAAPGAIRTGAWLEGANCQSFAYGVAGLFGLKAPGLSAPEFWGDHASTAAVEEPEPLDLVLFNASADPRGAHFAVWMGPDEILHLCHEVGVPVVWPLAEFACRSRYAALVGYKRITATTLDGAGDRSGPADAIGTAPPEPRETD